VRPRSEDPKLIIRVINFELVQLICSAYRNVTDRQTDRQTDKRTDGRTTYDSNTALALRASRGKNYISLASLYCLLFLENLCYVLRYAILHKNRSTVPVVAVVVVAVHCALRGIATVSLPSVRLSFRPSVCNVEVPWSYTLGYFENNCTNN